MGFNPWNAMEFEKKRTGIEERFYTICLDVVKENGYVLYDMDYIAGSTTLRLFIMDEKTNSAVIEDCIKVDRALSPFFEEDWVPESIVLEVSSPGVYRSLKTSNHFEAAKNEYVLLNLDKPLMAESIDGLPKGLNKAKQIRGKLLNIDNDNNEIKVDLDGFELNLTIEQIKKASLDPDL